MRRHESNQKRFSLSTALVAAMAAFALFLAPATANADDDDIFRAKTISPNQTYKASASEARDEMWYRFELKQAGPIKICITGASWWEWDVNLYTAARYDDDEILDYTANTRNGTHESMNIGLAAGTYYIEVEGDDDDMPRGATYSIKVAHSASSSWETELNDTTRLADNLKLNSPIKATTLEADDDDDDDFDLEDILEDDDDEDEDWFKLTLSEKSTVRMAFTNGTRSRGGWIIRLFNGQDFRGSRALLTERHRASESSFTSNELQLGAGTYYVKVDPLEGATGLEYTLEMRTSGSGGNSGTTNPSDDVKPSSGQMHRLYNRYTGEHFYTSSDNEFNTLRNAGWDDEGTGWIAPDSGDPVYRLYNPFVEGGDHHYTMSKDEYFALGKLGWRGEGVGWFSASKSNGVPVYRQYNPYAETGTHNYTTNKAENDALVDLGWKAEGVGWYAARAK